MKRSHVCSLLFFSLSTIVVAFGGRSSLLAEVSLVAQQPTAVDTNSLAPPANDAVKEATAALASGDLEKARSSLIVLKDASDAFHPEVVLVQLLFAGGNAHEGRRLLEQFAAKEPRRIDVYLIFTELAVGEQRWFDAWNLGNTAERLQSPQNWTASLKERVKNRLMVLKATSSEGRLDWTTARDTYLQLATAKEDRSEIWEGLARCEYKLGDIDKSLSYFQKIRASLKKTLIPSFAIAMLYESDGNVIKAEEYFQKAIATANATTRELTPAKLAFARFLIWSNRPSDAKTYLDTEIADSSSSETERLFLTAMVARMEQRFTDAQEILSRLHQQDSTSYPIGNNLALVLIESDQESLRGRALQIAEVNVRNNPRLVDAWATLGYVQFRLGDVASAEKSLNTSIQNGQLSRDAAFYLAKIKQSMGIKDDAKKLFDTAVTLPGPVFYQELNK